jgi:8-oxo-dGTP pyrophosphatase MutT (NUDIX family)
MNERRDHVKRRETGHKDELNSCGFTHAGGVVYRMNNNRPEFLVITSRQNPEHWILPRGHIESRESTEEAAVREIREETGLVGASHRSWARSNMSRKADASR